MRRTLFHRLPLLLLLLILPFGLAAADGALSFSEGDLNSVSLYDPYGFKTDTSASITEDGYIIRTGGTSALFSSPFGDISASENTLIAVTGFNYDSPSLYLLDGKAEITLSEDIQLTVYTTTASYTASGEGVYSFIYTDKEDKAENVSGSTLQVLDPLRGRSFTLSNGDKADMLLGSVTRYADTPLYEGSFPFMSWTISYTLYPSKAVISYPEWITDSEVEGFFAYLAAEESALFEGVSYALTAPGEATVNYGTELDAETQKSLVDLFASYIGKYAASLFLAQAEAEIRVEGSISYAGYSIDYSLGKESGTLTYPDVVTEADAEAFFAYLAAEVPGILDGATYSFTGNGNLTVSYGTELDTDTLEYLVKLFEEYLIKYLDVLFPAPKVPAAPSFKGVSVNIGPLLSGAIEYEGYAVEYVLNASNGTLTYPAIVTEGDVEAFLAYLAAAEPALLEGVTYSFEEDGKLAIDYGTMLGPDTLSYLVKLFEEYLFKYLDVMFAAPAAPAAPAVPAAPSFTGVSSRPVVILRGSIGYAGYTLSYELTGLYGTLTYPAIVTEGDVEAFFAYLASKEPALLEGVTYSFNADNQVVIEYGADLSASELQGLVEVFRSYLEQYLAALFTPTAPTFREIRTEVTNPVPSAPVFTLVRTTKIARVPEKPVLSVTVKSISPVPAVLSGDTAAAFTEADDSKKKVAN